MRSGFGGSSTDQEVTDARTGSGHNARRKYDYTPLDRTHFHYGFAVCLHSASRWTASAVDHQLAARGHNRRKRRRGDDDRIREVDCKGKQLDSYDGESASRGDRGGV